MCQRAIRALLVGHLDHLAKHDGCVAIKEGNAGKALAVLESVNHEGLGRLEHNLCHLVGLQGVGFLELLATSLLPNLQSPLSEHVHSLALHKCIRKRLSQIRVCWRAYLPVDLHHTAGGTATADKTNGRIASLQLTRDIQCLNLGSKIFNMLHRRITLHDHDITLARHVALVQTLDVHAHIVTRARGINTLVVHLHGEHLAFTLVCSGVGRHESDLVIGLDNSLLDAAGEHISDTLDLVDARNGDTQRLFGLTRRQLHNLRRPQNIRLQADTYPISPLPSVMKDNLRSLYTKAVGQRTHFVEVGEQCLHINLLA